MRAMHFLGLLALGACGPAVGVIVDKGVGTDPTDGPTDAPTDGDADTDADSDADVDADTDADTDTDTEPTPTGTTADTGDTGFVPPLDAEAIVDCNGLGDFTTIQAAIDASVSGDRIAVQPCVYVERIDFRGKALDVFSVQGPAVTILDGDSDGTIVTVADAESDGTRFAGFTLRNGDLNEGASAIFVNRAALDLQDLIIADNDRSLYVIEADDAMVEADGLVLENNEVAFDGYAIASSGGGFTGHALTVACDGGAVALRHHNTLVLSDSTIDCPGAVGVLTYHGEARIVRSVITGGDAALRAYDVASTPEIPDLPNELLAVSNSLLVGGNFGIDVQYMHLQLENSVLSGGTSALALTQCRADSSATATGFVESACGITSDQEFPNTASAFWHDGQDGCGTAVDAASTSNPRFVAWPTDVHLNGNSPWIDAGPGGNAWNDVDGSANDLGMFGGPRAFF